MGGGASTSKKSWPAKTRTFLYCPSRSPSPQKNQILQLVLFKINVWRIINESCCWKSLGIEIYAIVDWINIHYLFLAYQDEIGRSVYYYYYYLVKLSEEGPISKLLPVLSSTNMHECCIWAYARTYLNAESGPWVSDACRLKFLKLIKVFIVSALWWPYLNYYWLTNSNLHCWLNT